MERREEVHEGVRVQGSWVSRGTAGVCTPHPGRAGWRFSLRGRLQALNHTLEFCVVLLRVSELLSEIITCSVGD